MNIQFRVFILTISFLFLFPTIGISQGQQHVKAELQRGDGTLSLLRRYEVQTTCSKSYFFKTNGLRKNQGLVLHKSYELPIIILTYNGRSIRTTTGVNDYDWAIKVQEYNDRMQARGLKSGNFREDKILWVPYYYLNCQAEMTEAAATVISADGSTSLQPLTSDPVASTQIRGVYPILGPDYQEVPMESEALKGKVYYIVGGHGGPDPGAVGQYLSQSLCEDEYAYDVALRLCRNLLAHGATVYMIIRDDNDGIRSGEILPCDKDETCWINQEIPISQSERLTQRSDVINDLYEQNQRQGVRYQRLIAIHVDSNSRNQRVDMFFYHKEEDQTSYQFAETIRGTIKEKYDEYRQGRGYSGTVSSRDLHMLRESIPTSVYIELGNIKNRNDQARLVIEGNRQLIANWLFEGIAREALAQR